MTQLPVSFSLLNLGFRIDIVGLNLCLPEFRNQYLKREKHFNIDMLVEIKCQLNATDEFLLQILLLAQHVSGTIMPIIRSSRLLYKWLLPVVFGAWFSSCRYGVELRVVCPVCGLLQQPANRTHSNS